MLNEAPDTPCLVLDCDVLEANLAAMQAAVAVAGRRLRPHAKTHKCSALAKRQMQVGAVGVCVAKLSEAEALAAAGINNVLITGPVVSAHKLDRLARLAARASGHMAVVESAAGARALDAALRAHHASLDVLLDLDVGLGRSGIAPSEGPALAAAIAQCSHLRLRGVQAYAGHVQHRHGQGARAAASRACLEPAAVLFRRLGALYPTCKVLSTSGTGTVLDDLTIPDVTEVQPGSYVCMDAEYLAIGSTEDAARFTAFPPALRLLATVLSHRADGTAVVDAGLKALYRDGAAPCPAAPGMEGWTYEWFGDEYGRLRPPAGVAPPPVGTVVPFIVSHCDPTVNLFDRFFLARGTQVVGEWAIDLRGCSQ